MKRHPVPTAVTLAALACATATASAGTVTGASGQVSIGQVSYTLTDLDPNDGIAPSIVFADPNGPGLSPGSVFLLWSGNGTGNSNEVSAEGHEPITNSLTAQGVSTGGSVSGSTDPTTITISGYASVDGAVTGEGYGDANLWSSPLVYTLSPHTALTVTALAHLSGSASAAQDGLTYELTADAQIGLGGPNGWFSLTYPRTIDVHGGDAPIDRIELITGTDVNNGSTSMTGGLSLSARITALSDADRVLPEPIPQPVPEPRQLAMYGAGLPLLLVLRQRAMGASKRKTR